VQLQTLSGTIKQADAHSLANELLSEFTELGSEIQALSHRLHSSQLEFLGFVASVNALRTSIVKECGIQIELDHSDVADRIPPDVSLTILRVTQEALRNVVKHSEVEICLKGEVGKISLTVLDNGRGFNARRRGTSQGIGTEHGRTRANAGWAISSEGVITGRRSHHVHRNGCA
jgi:signal transduction histidine kinase